MDNFKVVIDIQLQPLHPRGSQDAIGEDMREWRP